MSGVGGFRCFSFSGNGKADKNFGRKSTGFGSFTPAIHLALEAVSYGARWGLLLSGIDECLSRLMKVLPDEEDTAFPDQVHNFLADVPSLILSWRLLDTERNLRFNDLTTLPEGIFQGLIALQEL